jgi:phosphotransferase system enzyme I (PtsI)
VASLFSAANPAVLRLVRQVIRSGIRYDVPVSMCGEVAGDPLFTLPLLGMGLKTFSCAPPAIPEIKQVIRTVTMEQALLVARRVMLLESENEITNYLRSELRKALPGTYGE